MFRDTETVVTKGIGRRVLNLEAQARKLRVKPQVAEKAARALGTREFDRLVVEENGVTRSLTAKDIELAATHGSTD